MSWDKAEAVRLATAADRPRRAGQLRIKRIMDVVGAMVALAALGPLLVIVAAVIVLEGHGPVLSRQPRLGRDGKPFALLKFRSVRSTPVDRFLHETGIAELPQLLNVLKGEMSLVGPRAHAPDAVVAGSAYRDLVPYYEMRLRMAPGMTGWAQVNNSDGSGNAAEAAQAGIDRDLDYIEDFSIALDLHILWATFRREFVTGARK